MRFCRLRAPALGLLFGLALWAVPLSASDAQTGAPVSQTIVPTGPVAPASPLPPLNAQAPALPEHRAERFFQLPIDASLEPQLPAPTTTPFLVPVAPPAPPAAPSIETVPPAGGNLPAALTPNPQAPPPAPLAAPFGSQLFTGQPQLFGPTAFNRNYIIGAGDQISIRVWGSYNYSGVQGVDPQGNIFIPQVGPVHVVGITNDALDAVATAAVKRVFIHNVDVYASLLSKQPVAVYVTGAVAHPGRYSGDRLDSPLQYIAQAGGIDPKSGSYRDITIRRGARRLAHIDLYRFLTGTPLPPVQFEVNDTIYVGFQRPVVTALGDVQNSYRFEIDPSIATGATVVALARPLATVSDVSIQGLRDGAPYNAYIPLAAFERMPVESGDTDQFVSDHVSDTIFFGVIGQSSGPSSFVVPRGTRLGDALELIEVDPAVADLRAIYLERQSVALQQQQALNEQLDQLRRSVLTTRSVSASDAAIHSEEAQLVQAFLQQVQVFRPKGIVVLAEAPDRERILLEPNDQIVIPPKSDVVSVTGEVRLPQSLIFAPGRPLADYVRMAGGFTDRADTSRYVLVHTSGAVQLGGGDLAVRPGDQIMVMPRTDYHGFAVLSDIVHVLYQIAVSSGITLRLVCGATC